MTLRALSLISSRPHTPSRIGTTAAALALTGLLAANSSMAHAEEEVQQAGGGGALAVSLFVVGLTADLIVAESDDVKAAVAIAIAGVNDCSWEEGDADSGFSYAHMELGENVNVPCGSAVGRAMAAEGLFGSGGADDAFRVKFKGDGDDAFSQSGDPDVISQWRYSWIWVEALAQAAAEDDPDGYNQAAASAEGMVDSAYLKVDDHDDTRDNTVGEATAVVSLESGDLTAQVGQYGDTEVHYYAQIDDEVVVDTLVKLSADDCELTVDGDVLSAEDFSVGYDEETETCTAALLDGDYTVEIELGEITVEALEYSMYAAINPDLFDAIEESDSVASTENSHGFDY